MRAFTTFEVITPDYGDESYIYEKQQGSVLVLYFALFHFTFRLKFVRSFV